MSNKADLRALAVEGTRLAERNTWLKCVGLLASSIVFAGTIIHGDREVNSNDVMNVADEFTEWLRK